MKTHERNELEGDPVTVKTAKTKWQSDLRSWMKKKIKVALHRQREWAKGVSSLTVTEEEGCWRRILALAEGENHGLSSGIAREKERVSFKKVSKSFVKVRERERVVFVAGMREKGIEREREFDIIFYFFNNICLLCGLD